MQNQCRVNRTRPKRIAICSQPSTDTESNFLDEKKSIEKIYETAPISAPLPASPQSNLDSSCEIELVRENQYLRELCRKQGDRLQNMVDRVSILEAGTHRICKQLNIAFDDCSQIDETFSNIMDEILNLKKVIDLMIMVVFLTLN